MNDIGKYLAEGALFLITLLLAIIGYFLKKENEQLNAKMGSLEKDFNNYKTDQAKTQSEHRASFTSEVGDVRAEFSDHKEGLSERFVRRDDYVREQVQTDSRLSAVTRSVENIQNGVMSRILDRLGSSKD